MNILIKYSIYTFILLFFSATTFAQYDIELLTVSGKVLDEKTNQPVSFLQVAAFTGEQTTPLVSAETDLDGNFSMKINTGTYTIKFFLLGYEDLVIPNVIVDSDVDMGEIELADESMQLGEVVVQSSKLQMRTNVEGLTINPDQNLSNLGGTLLDILRNTPSVSVSDDGSVSLRGSSGTNVLINGRNSSLTQNLDRIPASAIEQIKIINNPNARYDAEAEAGIIDIILKKGDNLGTNANIDALYGTRGRMNLGAQLNHRAIEFNIYGGYNLRRWLNVGTRVRDREIFGEGEFLRQETASQSDNLGHNFTYGGDYYFGKNILSYEGVYNTSLDNDLNTLYSRLTSLESGELLQEYVRRNTESETDDGLDNALIYERTFDNKERSFKMMASQSYTNQYKTQQIEIFRDVQIPGFDPEGQERAFTDEKRFNYIFQGDYIHPINESMKMEAGLKSNIRNFEYDYDFARFNEPGQIFEEDPAISNRFDYRDRIHAAYVILARTSGKWDITAGLRGELTNFETYLHNTDQRNTQNYFNLFPSLQTLYRLNDKHAAKFTYSRRIDRPTAWRLNPFPDITDSLNVRRGNPNLRPELINSLELGHIFEVDKASFTTNFFYRQVNGQLDFITYVEDGISYSQPENLNSAESYGMEAIGVSEFASWITLTGSATAFIIDVDGSNISDEFVNSGVAFNTKITSDFRLPLGFTLQLVFNYDSPEIEAQGRDLEQYFMDASIQKTLFNKKASVSLSVRDIFDTRRFAGNSLTDTFSQTFYSKRETRIILLSAKYSI